MSDSYPPPPPPDLPTLRTRPSWVTCHGTIDRAACVELRIRDIWPLVSFHNPEDGSPSPDGRAGSLLFLLTADHLRRTLRRQPARRLAGDFRALQANAMKPLPVPPGLRLRDVMPKNVAPAELGLFTDLASVTSGGGGRRRRMRVGAPRPLKRLAILQTWFQPLRLERWFLPGRKPVQGKPVRVPLPGDFRGGPRFRPIPKRLLGDYDHNDPRRIATERHNQRRREERERAKIGTRLADPLPTTREILDRQDRARARVTCTAVASHLETSPGRGGTPPNSRHYFVCPGLDRLHALPALPLPTLRRWLWPFYGGAIEEPATWEDRRDDPRTPPLSTRPPGAHNCFKTCGQRVQTLFMPLATDQEATDARKAQLYLLTLAARGHIETPAFRHALSTRQRPAVPLKVRDPQDCARARARVTCTAPGNAPPNSQLESLVNQLLIRYGPLFAPRTLLCLKCLGLHYDITPESAKNNRERWAKKNPARWAEIQTRRRTGAPQGTPPGTPPGKVVPPPGAPRGNAVPNPGVANPRPPHENHPKP